MNKEFLNTNFMKDLERMTGKEMDDIQQEDLNKIKRISFNAKHYEKDNIEFLLIDLKFLKNLEVVSFSGFQFTQEEMITLKSFLNLNFISFDFCTFNLESFDFNDNVKYLSFNVCKNLKLSMLNNTKAISIKIVGSELEKQHIDILDLKNAINLQELSLNNLVIKNINQLKSITPKLTQLNIDGSYIDENIEKVSFYVSHREKFYRADA
ncbi:MAG: hypothetical protein IJ220_03330 [Clostridia bacterium]|nr:hypothetical protein [Clostridia bacterium]